MSPRSKKSQAAKQSETQSKVTVEKNGKNEDGFVNKVQTDLEKNQSYLNIVLGALIVIVLGVLLFNYFNKPDEGSGEVSPSAQQTTDENGDVTKEALPGTYTVKEGDTLFSIAQKYFDDGNLYVFLIRENNLTLDRIETGQKLTIPRLQQATGSAESSPSASVDASASPSPSPSASPSESPSPSPSPSPSQLAQQSPQPSPSPEWGKGGAENQTIWGEKISSDTYTVQEGDWLSKIAGRSYGDFLMYQKIAQANNIQNPNLIEVGMVLKIPRD